MKKFVLVGASFALLLASSAFADDAADAASAAAAFNAVQKAPLSTNAGIARAIPNQGVTTAPIVGVPPIIGNFILVGPDETANGLPCFYCDPAGVGVSLTIPAGYITTALTTLDYSYMFQDVSINGTCNLAFALMQGSTVLDTATFAAGIYPATWVVTFPRSRPTASGQATAFGFVMCNGVLQSRVQTRVVLQ